MTYKLVSADAVPDNIVWITPARNAGQIVEVSYSRGIPAGTTANTDADEGDPWQRVGDRSLPVDDPDRVEFYRFTRR